MKHIKHIHDEDYDFSIKLMVPLLSILVCTICLCATTWAWYTASVSTGVNSIVAGANINETISIKDGNQILPNDGVYVIKNDTGSDLNYEITFNVGDAAYGYFAEITIEDVLQSTSFLDLFINRIYADENDIEASSEQSGSTLTNGNYYYYVNASNNTLEFSLQSGAKKQLKINYIWAEPYTGTPVYSGDNTVYTSSFINNAMVVNNVNSNSYSLVEVEQDNVIPIYKYSVRFIDNKTYEELRPEISEETVYDTVLLDDYQIEGYEVLSNSYDEIDEDGIYFYIDTEKEINTFVVLYEKVADSDDEEITNDESNTPIDTDATSGDATNQSTDGSVSDSNIKPGDSKENASQSIDLSLQPPGTQM